MEERLPTLIELIARTKEGKLPIDEVVFYYQDKHGEERFIHRDELKKEAIALIHWLEDNKIKTK